MIFKEDITYNDIISILSRNPKANVNFRYYQKRNESCLNNHLYHFILYDIFPVGYGHLDLEDNKL